MNTRHLTIQDLAGKTWRGLVRESTDRQADGWSPERQRDDLRRAADELGLIPVEPLFYERVGSGEAVGASEIAQALADAQRGEYEVLAVLHTSRFARNVGESRRLKAAFAKAGVAIYFSSQRLVSGTYVGALAEGVSELLDEHSNEERRFWIAGGQRQRQMSGRWIGIVPFGLRKVMVDRPDGARGWDGALEPDPATSPVVRSIFDAAARGEGSRTIATALNVVGHRTASGGPWRPGSIDAVLTNPVYAGRLVRYRARLAGHYYDHESDDGHAILGEPFPALIDGVLFDQIRAVRSARNPVPGSPRHRTYPLSGVLRCARCRRKMTGVRGATARYYRCSGRAVYKTCDAPGIRADLAERRFAEWLGSYQLPKDWRTAIARTRLAEVGAGERDRQTTLAARAKRLRDLFSWGDIDEAEYREQSAEVKSSMGVMALPSMPSIEAVAAALEAAGPAWLTAPAELQAAIPPLMLKALEVNDGQVSAFVVDAALRPLLDLCVSGLDSPYAPAFEYTVRFSA